MQFIAQILTGGGGLYDVLGSFGSGLLRGFRENNIRAYDFSDCIKNRIDIDIAVAFNISGQHVWKNVMKAGKYNVYFTVDSIFSQNFNVAVEYEKYDKFIALCVSPADFEAVSTYLPKLKLAYVAHGTDDSIWVDRNEKRENDIVFFSSMGDYEKKLEDIRNMNVNKKTVDLIYSAIDLSMKNPNKTFFEIYKILKSDFKIELDINSYAFLFYFVTTVVEQKLKIKMIQSLCDFNVKVWGSELWKKYVKGKVKYMGSAHISETIDIVNKSKIALHCHIPQLNGGLHERFLNASCAGAFCLSSATTSIQEAFGDSFGYFNHATFEDIKDKANYFLTHDKERIDKAQEARGIVLREHLWKNRAHEIDELFVKNICEA